MRILFDTNVLLDALLARKPFVREAAGLFAEVEHGRLTGLVSGTSMTTVYYVVEKLESAAVARFGVSRLLRLFEIASVGRTELIVPVAFVDYEDGVLHGSAVTAGADGIVTRDPEGFRPSTLHVYSPRELLEHLASA